VRYAGSGRLRRGPVRDRGLIWTRPRRFLSRPPTLQQIRCSCSPRSAATKDDAWKQADRSVGRGWGTQCLPASKRPSSAKVKPPSPEANAAVHFLSMMVRARARPICWRIHLRGRRRVGLGPHLQCQPALRSSANDVKRRCAHASTNSPTDGPRAGAHHHGEEIASCLDGPA
jgi:hypothetical protein